MNMFKSVVASSLVCASLLSFGALPAFSQDASCDASLTDVMVAIVDENNVASEGLVKITGCDDLVLTYEDGRSVNVSDVFVTQSGQDFFEMNVTFIAQNFFEPMPEEYRVDDFLFRLAPDLDTITADRSDLALNYQMGAADTVFFKFKDGDNVRFLKVLDVEGTWEIDLS